MSKTYIEWSQQNFKANKLDLKKHELLRANVLEWLEQAQTADEKKFDLIFLDPPSFSNSKRMEGTLDIQRDHKLMIEQTVALLNEGGELIFSNNRRGFKLDKELLEKFAIEDITAKSIDEDFVRNQKIHQCWLIKQR
jgi:23S rRNA (guanine2445-N2)-methyltransferase / 23S rRNA (guanine2069-N7)-methyltransferase